MVLPDGRVALLVAPMEPSSAVNDACMKCTIPHTHKYPYLTPEVLEELERTALTTRQASHVSWACQFAKLRCQQNKHGWGKWENQVCPAAWELVADAQFAWPQNDTSQYSDREAASRSWARWTWARKAFVRAERPRNPVAYLRELAPWRARARPLGPWPGGQGRQPRMRRPLTVAGCQRRPGVRPSGARGAGMGLGGVEPSPRTLG